MMTPGELAGFLAAGVASLSTLIIVTGVVVKKVFGGTARRSADLGHQAAVGDLTAEIESLHEEMSGMRKQVSELAERQDFTERLLTQARERGLLQAPKDQ